MKSLLYHCNKARSSGISIVIQYSEFTLSGFRSSGTCVLVYMYLYNLKNLYLVVSKFEYFGLKKDIW